LVRESVGRVLAGGAAGCYARATVRVIVLPAIAAGLAIILAGCQSRETAGSVSGTIEVDEVRVASRYGGRVESIHASEGEGLVSGQTLVVLTATELGAKRDQLAAQLAEAEAGPRPEELAAAKAEWEALTAQQLLAHAERQRAAELFADKTISATEYDRTVTSAQALERTGAAAKARYDLLRAGTRPERLAFIRAQLTELDAHLAEMKIVAPTNCVLEVLNVKVGDVLAPNQPVATLLLTNHLWARVFVPARWLGFIQPGDAVTVRVDSFPGEDFSGVVEQVQRSAEFTPRNVQTVDERVKQVFGVKVKLTDATGRLRAGMAADVFFPQVTP
jgi:HlyD family secretion protein